MKRETTLWIDVEDLILYGENHTRPSGIQRLAFEICSALVSRFGENGRVRFVRHAGFAPYFRTVPWHSVLILFDAMNQPLAPARPPVATPWRRFVSIQSEALGALAATARSLRACVIPSRSSSSDEAKNQFKMRARPGDMLVAVGSPWLPGYARRLESVQRLHGLRFGMVVYDVIPLCHPEWCNPVLSGEFKEWMDQVLPLADRIFAISWATARDVERYAARADISLRDRARAIPIGTGFRMPVDKAVRPGLPAPASYVLLVSTIEPRKNHALLFGVWRRLLEEMDPAAVPDLVFAGRVGWMVTDFMQMLENSHYLDGKIVFVDTPTDTELEMLYRGCLFTLFPSFCEGWGLPVSESLAFGKPCVISNATSLPEAGGALARYFDPEDMPEATRVIRAILEDRAGLVAWEEQVRREFRPVAWDETAQAVLDGM
jgi:glycosyltransferase involved in cell wall biosynthesis